MAPTSPLPPPPPGMNMSDDRRGLIIAVSLTTWLMALAVVVCRIVGRYMNGVKLWLDDWFVMASVPSALGNALAVAAYAVSRGLGKHIWVADSHALYATALGLFISEVCFFVTVVLIKISILSFYWRSFAVRTSMRWAIMIIGTIVCIWGILVLVISFVQCLPFGSYWERFDPDNITGDVVANCSIDPIKFFYGGAIPNIITDFIILLLPLPCIWRVQLPKLQKFALGLVILVGTFVTIISIIRFYIMQTLDLTNPDATWNLVTVSTWTVVEANLAVFCCCLPFLKPVMSRISLSLYNFSPTVFKFLHPPKEPGSSCAQKDNFRTWGVDGHLGRSVTHVKSMTRDGTELDEHPFAHFPDDASENASTRRLDTESFELDYVRGSPPQKGIMVSRSVHQQRESRS